MAFGGEPRRCDVTNVCLSAPHSLLERAALLRGHQDDPHQEAYPGQAHPGALRGGRAEHRGAAEPDQWLLPPRRHGEFAEQRSKIVAEK